MKVSIITPSLNSERYIENNLKSVHLQQKCEDFSIEQIIVDGNSTDRTIDLIEAFREKYNANIEIIQGKDKNMYDAINKGLGKITGDIWACLNTDDLYLPGVLELAVNEFSNNSGIDVVYGYLDNVDEEGKFLYTLYLPKFNLEFLVLRGYCLTISQPASFLSRRVLNTVGNFDINYRYASDYDYLIRVGANCRMKLIKKSFTQYRQHPESITYNQNTRSVQTAESLSISRKYMEKFGIRKKSLLPDNLKLYARQMKPKNIRYVMNRIKEHTLSNSWGWFLKERIS